MKLVSFSAAGVAAALCALSAPATASSIVTSGCTSVTSAAGCLFSGNINGNDSASNKNGYVFAQNQYNFFNNSHTSAGPDIALNYLGDTDSGFPGSFSFDAGSTTSGSWDLSGYLVDFFAVKAGDNFVLYELSTPASSGIWSTAGLVNNKGKMQGLSHIVFFGVQSAVPEPATWGMMIAGFGVIGLAMRRRGARAAISFS